MSTAAAPPSVELHNVGMRYEAWGLSVEAIRGVSLDLPERGLVLILGPNASGKSTLLRIIGGSLRPTSGTVRVFDRDPADAPARWRAASIGSVGQHPERDLVPGLTIEQHARLFGFTWKSFKDRLAELEPGGHFAAVFESAKQPVEALSGGQRQSLGLALQLVRSVPLLLLDEPFAALDAARHSAFTEMICRVAETRCVLNVTHAPGPLLAHAALIVRLAGGVAATSREWGETNGPAQVERLQQQ